MASFNKAIGYTPPPVAVTTVPSGVISPAEAVGNNNMAIKNNTQVDLSETAPIDTSESLMSRPISGGRIPVGTGVVDPVAPTVSTEPQFGADVGPQQGQKSLMDRATDMYDITKEKIITGVEDFTADPLKAVFGEDPIGTAVDRTSAQFTSALTDRVVQGKREAAKVYNTSIAGMPLAADVSQIGTSTEVQQRAQEMGYNPDAFQANNMWGAGAQNANYSKSMGFDRFAVRGGSI
tara:strand:- start:277 stop:981 length:705 start_codon:yes stop_codon:yes gene_type:complete